MRPKSIAVIIVAAGRGERVGGAVPKQFQNVDGEPVLARTIRAFAAPSLAIDHILPVIGAAHAGLYASMDLKADRLMAPVHGGDTRQASVLAGLQALAPHRPDYVLIHDAARPFVSSAIIGRVIEGLATHDGALPALGLTDTVKRSLDGTQVAATEDRATLFAAQTPQGFRFGQILSAHMRAEALPRQFTDDAEIAEWAGLRVALVQGDRANLKLTHAEDFASANQTKDQAMETRVGTGFDVHPFEPGDAVWLGGVRIPHTAKLKGHSDADAALHALTDAILGAIGEGDIGVHFPPSDMQWRGAPSTLFLKHAGSLVAREGGRIVNLDVTIVCEAPKIAPHVAAMQAVIAETLGISVSRVAIKATTSERLGFTGREEGIVAMASASVEVPRTQ
jgi:2-C-methyl-D-erythritol 4-phosphate cytidylyltransferase/2-C-methyl-D-erythritol 2,4-cyclodiphosphate synthase